LAVQAVVVVLITALQVRLAARVQLFQIILSRQRVAIYIFVLAAAALVVLHKILVLAAAPVALTLATEITTEVRAAAQETLETLVLAAEAAQQPTSRMALTRLLLAAEVVVQVDRTRDHIRTRQVTKVPLEVSPGQRVVMPPDNEPVG
jgi:hypothetical protein